MAFASGDISVKPGDSFVAARDEARAWRREHPGQPITIGVQAGYHYLDETLVLTAADSHTTWEGTPETMVSGGTRLTAIRVATDGTWRAPLPEGLQPEQLYVDGEWAETARWPDPDAAEPMLSIASLEHNCDENGIASRVVIHLTADHSEQLPPSGYTIAVMKDWALFRQRVASTEGAALTLKAPTFLALSTNPWDHNYMTNPSRLSGFRLWAEGHPRFISRPGEWAVDAERGELVYMPRPGQNPTTARVVVPRLRQLLRIEGTATAPVADLHIRSVAWGETREPLPATGHDGRQAAGVYGPRPREQHDPQAVIEAEYWQGGSFQGCRIAGVGGHGLKLGAGCREVIVQGCRLCDLGANAIMLGTARDPEDKADAASGLQVTDCLVERAGRYWAGAVGIWQGFASDSLIAYNRVRDLPYTGISMGWRWNTEPSSARGNRVVGNHISDVMRLLGDGGGIYTLGHQPDSEVAGNLVHDIHRSAFSHGSPNNGIYPDQGSSGIVYRDNVIYGTAGTSVRFHAAGGLAVEARDNILVPPPGESAGSLSPPYDKYIYFQAGTETLSEMVIWRDNTILDPASWTAQRTELLKGRHFGPRDPWRSQLGLEP